MNISGFRGTPLTRLLIFFLFLFSLLTTLTSTKHHFHVQLLPHLLHYHQVSRLALWQLIYANSGELLFAAAALYNLRVVERMFGTRKYASFILVVAIWTAIGAVVALFLINLLMEGSGRWGRGWNYLPPGPTGVVFALLAQYHAAVPSLYKIRFLPASSGTDSPAQEQTQARSASSSSTPAVNEPPHSQEPTLSLTLSDKLPIYILASQLALSQPPGSLLVALIGWIFGYAYRADVLPGSRWRIPAWLFDRSGGEYENLRRRLAAGEFATRDGEGGEGGTAAATGVDGGGGAAAQRRPLMGQILDQFRGAF
ncbi:hypothetical protein BDZ91DRAFT_831127 [Kalaharituber pfeilii]|nr:hypothetical protein BDZ91DRAFT_831127 [Kalaharituber pfeilii]